MSSVIKVNACVYSRIGYGRVNNTSSFYMNGKFSSEHHIDNVQASLENRGLEYLFSVSDNMDCDYPEQEINVSILKELRKFHEKITVGSGDIQSKAKELKSRVNETERLIESFLEMNRIQRTDSAWDMGFSGLLLSDGQLVALTSGNGRIYMMRDGMFRPLASETAKAKREIENRIIETGEDDEIELPGDEERGSVIVSDIYDIHEGDSFILLSDGLYQALGEEKIEDLLALRSDSSYIAYRLVDEAMKRNTVGDITALVVQVEKLTISSGSGKRPALRTQTRHNVRTRVDKLNKAPAITYKYNRRNANKYQSTVLIGMVIVSVVVLFGILFLMISSLMNTGRENAHNNTPTTTVSPSTSPTMSPGETDLPTEEPDETPDPGETPEPTPTPTPQSNIQTHVVKKGDSMSAITRQYYGDTTLLDKLCKYNNISDPDKIIQGQVIKIPPKEVLKEQD
jgi:serine/threonine protein phosphatase PrpC/LysM repeat protein